MPNILNADGLQVQTRAELLAYLTAKYQEIYGSDINLGSDTPDGQMMNIFIQMLLDQGDLLVQIYNSFSPDTAIGKVLDQRAAINGIQRQAGTYTITSITLEITQSVNLYGLDQEDEDVYTISDNAGNQWLLIETELGLNAGTHILSFRAALPGEQLTIPNTINVPVSIVLGVQSVNNPTTYTTLGINEESDAQFRVRRQKSVSLASQGYLAGLRAAIQNITGVTSAEVYENTTGDTDADGVPGHSIWVIVGGTGDDEEIAQAIYTKRNAGCGMKGGEEYTITQVDGTPFVVRWDEVVAKNLFIKFVATSINGTVPPNIAAIRAGLVTEFVPGINTEININQLATVVQQIDPNTLVTEAGFSTGVEQTLSLSGIAASGTFKINYNGNQSAAINWNDNLATILGKIQSVSGLEDAALSGSIASQELVIDLSALENVLGLIYVSDNSLATGGAVAITFSYDADYQLTFLASKQYQPVVAEENIIITPVILNSASATVLASADVQLSALGGYGDYTYSIQTNNSGGSINASTGLYTAGSTDGVIDTLKVTDALGNTATVQVTVV